MTGALATGRLSSPRQRSSDVDRHRLAVSVHEAGHSIAAVVLGATLRSAVVFDGDGPDGLLGETTYVDLADRYKPQVAYAGPWAEARFRARQRPGIRDINAVIDSTGQRDHRSICDSGSPTAGRGVVPVLDRCWDAVKAVATELFIDGEVDHTTVSTALGLSGDPDQAAFQLACLRSGIAPGGSATRVLSATPVDAHRNCPQTIHRSRSGDLAIASGRGAPHR